MPNTLFHINRLVLILLEKNEPTNTKINEVRFLAKRQVDRHGLSLWKASVEFYEQVSNRKAMQYLNVVSNAVLKDREMPRDRVLQ